MVINNTRVNHANATTASQLNAQLASKLARQENANKMLTNLRVKALDVFGEAASSSTENTVMTGFTVIADTYKAFDQSFAAALDPITKQMEKDQAAIQKDAALTDEQKAEQLSALAQSYGENVSRVAEELTSIYGGMLKGVKQLYGADGQLNQAMESYTSSSLDDLTISMEHLQLLEIKHDQSLDEIQASIKKARELVKLEQEQVIEAGKDYGNSVIAKSSQSEFKITKQDLQKMRTNSMSKMLNMMMYSSIAAPAKSLATTVNSMFNLGSMFSRYNLLV